MSIDSRSVEKVIWIVNQARLFDDVTAGVSVDLCFEVGDPLAAEPESRPPQPASSRYSVVHRRVDLLSKLLNQGREEPLSSFSAVPFYRSFTGHISFLFFIQQLLTSPWFPPAPAKKHVPVPGERNYIKLTGMTETGGSKFDENPRSRNQISSLRSATKRGLKRDIIICRRHSSSTASATAAESSTLHVFPSGVGIDARSAAKNTKCDSLCDDFRDVRLFPVFIIVGTVADTAFDVNLPSLFGQILPAGFALSFPQTMILCHSVHS